MLSFNLTNIISGLVSMFGYSGGPKAGNVSDNHVITLLGSNNYDELNDLFDQGLDANRLILNSTYMLQLASWWCSENMVRLLIERGADVTMFDLYDPHYTALHYAAESCDSAKMINDLLMAGANVNALNNPDEHFHKGNTPLHLAVRSGHKENVKALLTAHPDLEIKNYNGDTPLHIAAYISALYGHGHLEVIRAITNAGADISAKDANGRTAENIINDFSSWELNTRAAEILGNNTGVCYDD